MSNAADKKAALLEMLRNGLVGVHLDARVRGVRVPAHLAESSHLRLNLSYRFAGPDMLVTTDRIAATLTFNRTPFRCVIPWSAVWAFTAGADVRLFGESMPDDLESVPVTHPAPRQRMVN